MRGCTDDIFAPPNVFASSTCEMVIKKAYALAFTHFVIHALMLYANIAWFKPFTTVFDGYVYTPHTEAMTVEADGPAPVYISQ